MYNKTKWTTYTAGRGLGVGSALANHRNLEYCFGQNYPVVTVSANTHTFFVCAQITILGCELTLEKPGAELRTKLRR
jgi:hypothetical protein